MDFSVRYRVSNAIRFELNDGKDEEWKNVDGESGLSYKLNPTDQISRDLAGLENLIKPGQFAEIRGVARPPKLMVHTHFDSTVKYPSEIPWKAKV